MDESRKAFEQWFPEMVEGIPPGMVEVFDKMLFMAWQASRAAIEIKLDDKVMVEDDFDKGHNCAIDYCAEAIRAAGIKVKE
ncbi:hypothetical protein OFE56_001694 [Salmonella enterica subsp. enterica serovar Montevideo]|nr:hypothetical protein [Salmonella enterica subsp. enterica]EJQ8327058.1 hypothetical protein [Salmonella enterica subsp. enterica serovar Braenderup]EJW0477105.1 hypothetical protein [Salmonella enterica subsp. enterica serovar Braenderup]ELA5450789.1 hypothetical protein [Salmonella enterica subsp. enterica serovar Montevideo]ELM5048708.1 hypothetical protein [Salmonella enterica]